MRTFTDIELVQRGERARALFEQPAYKDAYASLLETYTAEITGSNVEDTARRELYFFVIRGLQLLHTELESHVMTGLSAAQRISEGQLGTEDTTTGDDEF